MEKSRSTSWRFFLRALSWGWVAWFAIPYLFLLLAFLSRAEAASMILRDGRFWAALLMSAASSGVVVFLTAVFTIPLAYFLTYTSRRAVGFLEALLIDIPQTFPPVAIGVLYLFLFGPRSPINLAFTFVALIIAKLFVAAPFGLSYTMRKFREIRNAKLDLVARSLGAGTRDLLFRVFIPIARRDIAAGLTLSWARAMGEFGGSLIFAGVVAYRTEILPTYTNRVVGTDPFLALAATMVLTCFVLLTISVVRLLLGRGREWS